MRIPRKARFSQYPLKQRFFFFFQGNEIQRSECFGVFILQVVDCFVFLLRDEALMVKENGQKVL